uniref:Uncharacterized protein n=1 Tax=Anopheles christyi TaxID=43041 RepID=A0A182KDU3_9DIPT
MQAYLWSSRFFLLQRVLSQGSALRTHNLRTMTSWRFVTQTRLTCNPPAQDQLSSRFPILHKFTVPIKYIHLQSQNQGKFYAKFVSDALGTADTVGILV